MASFGENEQWVPNGMDMVPYCPVALDAEPISTMVPVPVTSTYEVFDVNNNVILAPIPVSLYDPNSGSARKKESKLKTTKVIGVSYNNKFKRVSRGNKIEYMWERDGHTNNHAGFKHELLENWTVETRLRQNGKTTERYFYHARANKQFRSIKSAEEFIAQNLEMTREELEVANKEEVERFLADSYENLRKSR